MLTDRGGVGPWLPPPVSDLPGTSPAVVTVAASDYSGSPAPQQSHGVCLLANALGRSSDRLGDRLPGSRYERRRCNGFLVTSENGRLGLPLAGWLGFWLRLQPSEVTVRRAQEAAGAHGGLASVGLDVPATRSIWARSPRRCTSRALAMANGPTPSARSAASIVIPRRTASQLTVTGSTGWPAASRSRMTANSSPCSGVAKWPGRSHPRTPTKQAGGAARSRRARAPDGFRLRTGRTPLPRRLGARRVRPHVRAGSSDISDLLSNHREPLLCNVGV